MTADAVGGVWQYCVDLVRALAGKETHILLATMGRRPSPAQRRQLAGVSHIELEESDYALEWQHNPWLDVDAAGDWLLTLQARFKPDLIHLNGYSHAVLPWGRPVLVTAHSCVFSWWRAVHLTVPGAEWNEYRRRVVKGLDAAAAIVVPTASMGHALSAEYSISDVKTRVINNFSGMNGISGVRKQAFCLGAGRMWDPAKNLTLFERVAPKLHWPVRVAGSGQAPNGISVTANSLTFLGALDHEQLLNELSRASIFLHPALYEPFGLSVLEAALSRCCLVLADIPSLRELWDGAAKFVDPRDPEGWATAVNLLIADPGKRELYAARAYSRAASFNSELTATQYMSLYNAIRGNQKLPGVAA